METKLQQTSTPEPFHILSFEGPDAYARAGGIASRVTGLAQALAEQGHPTSLWFVGDPNLPGQDQLGDVQLHRWCQWISAYHPAGAYDGEYGKVRDYSTSLPPHLLQALQADVARHGRAVVLAEEWHTADAVLHLDVLLRKAHLRDRVAVFWNANNTFGFNFLDWKRLNQAATITTVSRYMRMLMLPLGVDPLVIHNGLGSDSFKQPSASAVQQLRNVFAQRTLLTKVARWDPDKRWLLAIDTTANLKHVRARPLLVARGGLEAHEHEVLTRARQAGLRIEERKLVGPGEEGLVDSLQGLTDADVLLLRSHLDAPARAALFQAADAVLANSAHEPFGLVGLEAMAVGGLACTGVTGEDYAIAGQNALMLQQDDPSEFVRLFSALHNDQNANRAMRQAGLQTADRFAWAKVVSQQLLPHARPTRAFLWTETTEPAPHMTRSAPPPGRSQENRRPSSFSVFSGRRESGRQPGLPLPNWLTNSLNLNRRVSPA